MFIQRYYPGISSGIPPRKPLGILPIIMLKLLQEIPAEFPAGIAQAIFVAITPAIPLGICLDVPVGILPKISPVIHLDFFFQKIHLWIDRGIASGASRSLSRMSSGIYFWNCPGNYAGICAEISIGIPDWIPYNKIVPEIPLVVSQRTARIAFEISLKIPVGIPLTRKLSRGISETGCEINSGIFPLISSMIYLGSSFMPLDLD